MKTNQIRLPIEEITINLMIMKILISKIAILTDKSMNEIYQGYYEKISLSVDTWNKENFKNELESILNEFDFNLPF